MTALRVTRARWIALCQTLRPALEHAAMIYDTRLRIALFDVHGR